MLSEAAGARAREPPSKKARRSTCEKLYPAMTDIVSRIAAWRQQRGLASHTQQIVPDPQQMSILEAVAERCVTEAGEQDSQRGSPCARMFVLGLPGSGKSEVVHNHPSDPEIVLNHIPDAIFVNLDRNTV